MSKVSKNKFQEMFLSEYPDMLSVKDIQKIFGISKPTAYNFIKDERLKCLRIGSRILIPKVCVQYIVFKDCTEKELSDYLNLSD